MKHSAFLVLFFSSLLAHAQDRPGKPGGPGGRERPAIGVVYGKVVDSETGKPMEFVTVSVESQRDSSVFYGTVTDRKGYFKVSEIKVGAYWVSLNYMGYNAERLGPVRLTPKESVEQDLGTIRMEAAISELGTAEIVEEKPYMEVRMDKKVYNVEENITTTGGSVNEVLENIPSVEVDIDGNISLRGSQNLTVLIDGKPSGLTGGDRQALLDQIPASSIEAVEVITNPSAKYDPDGMAGIINVVLKKNKLEGFYGNLKLTAGNGNNYNASLGLNYRNDKVNLFSSYGFRYQDRFSRRLNYRETYFDDVTSLLDQTGEGDRSGGSHTVRLGADWYLTPSKTLSISGKYGDRNNAEIEANTYLIQDPLLAFDQDYVRAADGNSDRSSIDLNLGFRQEFGSREHYLKADAFASRSINDSQDIFTESWYDGDGLALDTIIPWEVNQNENLTDVLMLQVDYERPMPHKGKFEAGAKSIIRDMDTDFVAGFSEDGSEPYFRDDTRSNDFEYNEQIHAAYSTYGRQFGDFGVQLGARLEQVFTDALLVNTGEDFENDYLSLFPSANLSYNFTEKQILQLSYSRRINRPRTRQLNPFPIYSDPLNLRKGNPFLLPEYANSVELGFTQFFGKNMLSSAVYYRGVSNVIRRFKTIDTTGVSTTTYENIAGSESYGIELIANFKPLKWWNLNASFNWYRSISDGSNLESDLEADATSWFLRGMSTWKWGNGWEAQVSGRYKAPQIILQGEFSGFLSIDAALQKSILDKKGSLNLRVSDIFNTREFDFETVGADFFQEGNRKRESRFVYLTFSYRFGKLEERKRRGGSRNGDDGGGFDGMEID